MSLITLSFTTGSICANDVFSSNKDSLMASSDSLVATSDSISIFSIVQNSQQIIDSLKNLIDVKETTNTRREQLIDSLFAVVKEKDLKIQELTKARDYVDTCMLRFANRWLYEKYNEKDVDEAINYFNRILSNQLRTDYSVVVELLKCYKTAYKEFLTLLQTAQNDAYREDPFESKEYKERYTKRLESMTYYVRYYKENWNIRYLNERIKIAEDRLRVHETKTANFQDLIDELSE